MPVNKKAAAALQDDETEDWALWIWRVPPGLYGINIKVIPDGVGGYEHPNSIDLGAKLGYGHPTNKATYPTEENTYQYVKVSGTFTADNQGPAMFRIETKQDNNSGISEVYCGYLEQDGSYSKSNVFNDNSKLGNHLLFFVLDPQAVSSN